MSSILVVGIIHFTPILTFPHQGGRDKITAIMPQP